MRHGYVVNNGNKDYIILTDRARKCNAIYTALLKAIAEHRKVDFTDTDIADFLAIPQSKRFKNSVMECWLEFHENRETEFQWYSITGKNFSWSFPIDDYQSDVIEVNEKF